MLSLRSFFLKYDTEITEAWKYRLPFFYYKNKPFCYIWKDSKTQQPYIGIVKASLIEHPLLIQGNRKKIKIISFKPSEDIPVLLIDEIFQLAMQFY